MNKIKTISILLIVLLNLTMILNLCNQSFTIINDSEVILEFEDDSYNFDIANNDNGNSIQNTRNSDRDIWIDTFSNENYIESQENIAVTNGDATLKSQMIYSITSTPDFDAGTNSDIVTETDEYQVPSGQIQLGSPSYEKDASLVLFLPLNEGAGTTANDESSFNNDGNIYGATWVNGKYEKGLDFDGTNDYVLIPDQNEFSISTTGSLSVEFWLKTGNDITTRQELIAKGGQITGETFEWMIRIKDGNLHGSVCEKSGNTIRRETVSVSVNTWYHVAIIYKGYTQFDDVEIYIDSVEKSNLANQANNVYSNENCQLGIGREYTTTGWHYFKGILDEVKIYNRILTSQEVQGHYNSGNRYKSTGTWESAVLPWLTNYRFLNTTLTHSGLSATEKITEVRWKVGGTTKAIYSDDITSGSTTKITNSDLTSGSFNFITNDFTIEISLAGNGDATPVVEQIDGTSINTAGTLTSNAITLTTNNCWDILEINKTVPINTSLLVTVLDGGTDQPLAGFSELSETYIDISSIDPLDHPTIKLKADLTTNNLYTPQLHYWEVSWGPDKPTKTTDIPSDWSFPEDTDANNLIDLTNYFEDIWTPDNKLRFAIVSESDDTHIDANVDGKFLDFTTPTVNWSGHETFKVKCTDEGGLAVNSNEFMVTVTEVNDPPEWTPIGYIYIDEDSELADVIALDEHITDCDDVIENISYSIISNNNPSNVLAQIANRHVWVEPLIKNYVGSAIIRLSANDGLRTANITFELIIDPINDLPIVELLSPGNNSLITTTSTVTLTWSEGFDVDGTIRSYDVYLDQVSPPQTLISNDQTVTSFTIQLEDGIYYWTAIPYDGTDEGLMDPSKIWSFTISTEEEPSTPAPTITLSSPYNNTIINTESIELFWNDNTSFADLRYLVYFDTEATPNKIVGFEITTTSIIIFNLTDGGTYFWTVIPISGVLMGSCEDRIWSFTVQLDFVPVFEVELTGIDNLIMNQSETRFCNLTITNNGNVRDIYTPELEAGALNRDVKFHNLRNIMLEPEESTLLSILISLPEDAATGYHNITVTISSYWGGKTINDTHQVQLKIEPKALPPSGPVTKDRSDSNLVLWLVLIIIVVVILIAIAVVTKKRRQKMEAALKAEGIMKPAAGGQVLLPDIVSKPGEVPRLGAAGVVKAGTVTPILKPVVGVSATQTVVPKMVSPTVTPQLPRMQPPAAPSPQVQTKPEKEMSLDDKLKLLNERLIKGEITQELYEKLRKEFELKSRISTPTIQPKLPPMSPKP